MVTNTLQKVVAPAVEVPIFDSLKLFLTSVEFWTNEVHVILVGIESNWTEEDGVPSTISQRLRALSCSIRDGNGQPYQIKSESGNGSAGQWRLIKTFEPGAPNISRELTIDFAVPDRAGSQTFRIELSD